MCLESSGEGEANEILLSKQDLMPGKNARLILQPEPGTFSTPGERSWNQWKKYQAEWQDEIQPPDEDRESILTMRAPELVDLRKDFGKLQTIVKLSNICVAPEKPNYEGGSWHVEGQANEAMYSSLCPLN